MAHRMLKCLICLALCLQTAAAAGQSPADVSQINGVEVEERQDGTAITVLGSESPTFSVYRLERPARLFIDFSNTELIGDVTNWSVRNGLVEDVLALQYRDDLSIVTRVVITLEDESADYDIEPGSGAVTVIVTGERRPQVAELEARERELTAAEAEIAELQRAAAQAEARAEEVLGEYETALRALRGYQEEIASQQRELDRLTGDSDRWQTEVERLHGELNSTRSQLEARDAAIRAAEEEQAALRRRIEDLQAEGADQAEAQAEVQRLRGEIDALEGEYQALLNEAGTATDALEVATAQLLAVNQARDHAEARVSANEQELHAFERDLDRLQDEATRSGSLLAERNSRLAALQEQVEQLAGREATERERADTLSTELDDARQELRQARDGEQEAQQAVDQLAERAAALERELAQLTEMAGERNLLASELEEVRDRRETLESELVRTQQRLEELHGEALAAVQSRERYERETAAAEQALRRAEAEADEAQRARQAAQQAAAEALADLENTQTLLEQQRDEHEQLAQEVAQARRDRETLSLQLEQLANDQLRQEQQLVEAREQQLALEASIARLAEERAATERELAEARAERQRAESELAELEEERGELSQAIQSAEQRRRQIVEDLDRLDRERTQAQAALEAARQARAAAADDRSSLETELDQLQERRVAVQRALDQAARERERMQGENAALEAELTRLASERDALEASIEAAELARREVTGSSSEAERELAQLHSERDALEAALAEAERERQSMLRENGDLEVELESLATELTSIRSALDAAQQERDAIVASSADAEGQLGALQSDIEVARSELDEVVSERERLAGEVSQLEGQLAQLEAERREREEAERRAELEAEQQAELEAERQARLEAERQARLEAERQARLEAERQAQLEAERREREEAERQAELEAERQARTADPAVEDSQLATAREDSASSPERGNGRHPAGNASPPAESSEARRQVAIVDVRFEQVEGTDRISVEFEEPLESIQSLPWDDSRAGLLIEGASLPAALERRLDTRAFGGPVQFVSSFTDPEGEVRLVADVSQASSEILSLEGRTAHWEFASLQQTEDWFGGEQQAQRSEFDGYNAQEQPAEPPPIRRERGVSYTIGERRQRRRVPQLSRRFRVTIDVVNADIQNVLRLFSDEGDVNIIASGSVQGSVTLRLRDVPLDLAFALILQSQGLGWEQQGNIIRVAPQEEFDQERERELQRIASAFDVEPLQVRLRPISYAEGEAMLRLLGDVLSSRGTASFDERTHTLILTDVAENLDAAEQLIDALDTQTPQILIEARIVQMGETYSVGFGIQWGGDALFSPANGNATGLLFPSTIGIAGGAGQSPADGTAPTPNYAVNLPGPQTGAIGFQFGSLGQAVNLNLRLSAAESRGEAHVVSAPRILTLDGQTASISTGLSIPVQTVSAAGANVTFINANLSLTVTPTVTPDGFVHLDLDISKNEPDFGRLGANGDPTIITRTAQTRLLVRDGETSVIGGIFEHISGTNQQSVPFFSDIPVLGALFHDYSFQDERQETLVFITPRIVNRDLSLANYAPGGVLMTPPGE